MNFIEITSDLGGFRLGLESAGWRCVATTHWGALLNGQSSNDCCPVVLDLGLDGKNYDAIAIEAPVGDRVSGTSDSSGNWWGLSAVRAALNGVPPQKAPPLIFLVGRTSMLSDHFGSNFADLLLDLNRKKYAVSWVILNLSWLGIPQDASRVVVIASRGLGDARRLDSCEVLASLFMPILNGTIHARQMEPWTRTQDLLESRRPRIGLRAPKVANPFGRWGIAHKGKFTCGSYQFREAGNLQAELKRIFVDADSTIFPSPVSVRFVSRAGIKGLQIKANGLAHSMGPNVSAWPLFATPENQALGIRHRTDVSNWHRTAFGFDIIRLTPARALMLFGEEAKPLESVFATKKIGMSEAYRLASATVPPRLASRMANAILQLQII